MLKYFRPKPGRLGFHPVFIDVSNVGNLTANTTNRFHAGAPYRRAVFLRFGAVATTVPVDADGTILARVVKYDASADAEVTLSADINLEALVTREVSFADALSTATDAQLVLDDGDSLQIHVVNNTATIDTQPTLLSFTVELGLLE